MVTAVIAGGWFHIDPPRLPALHSQLGVTMKDIHEVLRRKQAQYAQLGRHIEALQAAAEKLRMVAPLLAEEGEDTADVMLGDLGSDEATPAPQPMAKAASAAASPSPAAAQPSAQAAPAKPRTTVPRWP